MATCGDRRVIRMQKSSGIRAQGRLKSLGLQSQPPAVRPTLGPFDDMCKRIGTIVICSENVHPIWLKSVKSLVFYIYKMPLLPKGYRELNCNIIVIFRKET